MSSNWPLSTMLCKKKVYAFFQCLLILYAPPISSFTLNTSVNFNIKYFKSLPLGFVGQDSTAVQRISTGWPVWGSNPFRGEIFRTRPDRFWGRPSLLYNGYRVFPGSKAAGAWRWPPTLSSAEVKERIKLYLYSTSGPSWPVTRWNLPLFYFTFTLRVYTSCLMEHTGISLWHSELWY